MKWAAAIVLLTLALTGPAAAQAFKHDATGFGVDLPKDFVVNAEVPPQPAYDILVGITSRAQPDDFSCEAGFQGSDGNSRLTQRQINAMATGATAWTQQVRAGFSLAMTIDAFKSFRIGDLVGVELIATPKFAAPTEDIRLVISLLETRRGRTMLICNTTASTIDEALPVFRRMREGLIPPR